MPQSHMIWCHPARSIVVALAFVACGGHAAKPEASPPPRASAPVHPIQSRPAGSAVSVGAPCASSNPTAMLDRDGRLIDTSNEESLEKAMGQPILVCAPVRRALAGSVLDEATKAPVAGATVTIESWHTPAPIGGLQERRTLRHSISVLTDAQGQWSVPAQSDWMSGILAADGLPFFTNSWCVSAPGYETLTHDPWKHPRQYARDVSEITIKRGTPSPPLSDHVHSACGLVIGEAP